jgi:rhomboid family GlyGly-CTERM serine protease
MSRPTLILILALWLILGLCQILGGEALAYDRERIGQGAYGLLLSGHLVHLNNMHLLLNMLGLALVLTLFDRVLAWWLWLLLLLSSALAISLGLYLLLPQVDRYVGLSGVIHSLYAAGAVALLRTRERKLALVLLALLTLKLLTEGYGQGISLTADLIGGHVLVQAHLYGAIFGVATTLAGLLHQYGAGRKNKLGQ